MRVRQHSVLNPLSDGNGSLKTEEIGFQWKEKEYKMERRKKGAPKRRQEFSDGRQEVSDRRRKLLMEDRRHQIEDRGILMVRKVGRVWGSGKIKEAIGE